MCSMTSSSRSVQPKECVVEFHSCFTYESTMFLLVEFDEKKSSLESFSCKKKGQRLFQIRLGRLKS